MPRTARLDAPGVLHHIMIQGIERQRIFRDIQDRDDLLERLSVILLETHTSCYAWPVFLRDASLSGSAAISSEASGGWKEVKRARLNRQDGVKGDERILRDVFRQQEKNEHACMLIWSHKF